MLKFGADFIKCQLSWKQGLRVIGVAILSASLAACDQSRVPDAEAGEVAYLQNCSRCHQIDGRGYAGVYPRLAGSPIVTLHDPNPMIDIILDGSGGMPAFRHRLEAEELAALMTYARNAWGNNASPVTARQIR